MGRCSDGKQKLIGTATRLFHERGFTAVSVADICEAADLKKGSFYHFFESKQDLMMQAIDAYEASYAALIGTAVRPEASAREQLQAIAEAIGAQLVEQRNAEGCTRGCPIGNLALEMAGRDEELRRRIEKVFAGWRAAFTGIVQRGIERGEFAPQDPARAAEAVVAMMQGAMVLAKTANDPSVFARLLEQCRSLVLPAPSVSSAATASA